MKIAIELRLEKLKKYKKAVIILVGLIFFIVFLILQSGKDGSILLPPVDVTDQAKKEEEKLYFLMAEPPSGYRETPESRQVMVFQFSKPIDKNSITIKSRPYIPLDIRVHDHSPNKMYISPKEPWIEGTKYFLTISGVRATTGERLYEPVQYTYLYQVPEVYYVGDSVPIPWE